LWTREYAWSREWVPFYFMCGQLHAIQTEMFDFLATRPTLGELIAYKISPVAQLRLEELLEKNRESQLTNGETAELDTFQAINHLMILLKARARAAQAATN
jgi:hypothetical protein